MNSDLLKLGRRILAEQPFSVLLGAELTAFEPGRAELRLPVRQELKQQHGFVHGGVVSYLADNALTYAGGSANPGQGVVTSEFKINYLRPAIGDVLIARASVLYAGKTQIVCRCDIFAVTGTEEKLCATAQGTIAPLGAPSKSDA
ncbi:MAG: thioesterase [Rhodocyclaceae bacterium]|nr:MAG: thioesterase [Rhodocyclaceae bacterium]TND05177.1 MAG: thioesterase [Rhodocyclaceae bacterium]